MGPSSSLTTVASVTTTVFSETIHVPMSPVFGSSGVIPSSSICPSLSSANDGTVIAKANVIAQRNILITANRRPTVRWPQKFWQPLLGRCQGQTKCSEVQGILHPFLSAGAVEGYFRIKMLLTRGRHAVGDTPSLSFKVLTRTGYALSFTIHEHQTHHCR